MDLLSRCYRIKEKLLNFGEKDDDYHPALLFFSGFHDADKKYIFLLVTDRRYCTFTSALKDKKLLKSHKTIKNLAFLYFFDC